MTQALASDRYDHDMTANNFLCWLRTQSLLHRPHRSPDLVHRFLTERGYPVVDTCSDTAVLQDSCGCRHVRALPTAVSGALRAMEFGGSVRNLIAYLEARI